MARIKSNLQEEKLAARRELAIKFGQEIVAKKGLSALSIRSIAKKLHCSIGAIYSIFKNTDEMILCVNAVTLSDMKEFIESNVKNNSSYIKNIKEMAKFYIIFAKQNYNRWSALFEFKILKKRALPKWYKIKIADLLNLIEKPLSLFLKNDKEIKSATTILWAGIQGICILNLSDTLAVDDITMITSLTDSFIENYLLGLKK